MNKYDILVVVYPNIENLEAMLIIDPYDKKVSFHEVNSVDDIKRILKENLPFCSQGHEPQIHFGSARVIDWEKLIIVEWDKIPLSDLSIKTPEDIDEELR